MKVTYGTFEFECGRVVRGKDYIKWFENDHLAGTMSGLAPGEIDKMVLDGGEWEEDIDLNEQRLADIEDTIATLVYGG